MSHAGWGTRESATASPAALRVTQRGSHLPGGSKEENGGSNGARGRQGGVEKAARQGGENGGQQCETARGGGHRNRGTPQRVREVSGQ